MASDKYDAEEQEIIESYERGEWQSVSSLEKEKRAYQKYAMSHLEKSGLISIQLPKEDIDGIKQKAREKGIPYQALISEVLHQFVTGRLVKQP